MVGDGPDRPRASQRAEAFGISDRVTFLGKHVSVEELLACADLFILPSDSESFGLAALEAIACGAPVIATDAGGLPEVIPHGEAGYLFPVGDVEGMAEGGIEILSSEDTWKRMSEAGRAVATERFSAERVLPVYEDYYREIVASGRARARAAGGDGGADRR
jgi:glycosyltransferase involved in cell wall biosynthesis